MESLSETVWDVIISGTGIPQSMLALALSRSNKNVLHIDPNDYYGGPEAAFSLQEADDWAAAHAAKGSSPADMFTSATVTRPESSSPKDRGSASLSSSRAYSLTLSPQIIYTRSALLSQLVSSRAYRQLEFLALGSSYVLRKQDASQSSSADSRPSLTRIPFSREAIFASQLSARSKRALMKFIKFVLSAESSTGPSSTQPDDQAQAQEAPGNISASASTTPSSILSSHASSPLSSFLSTQFSLDAELQAYVLALTLNLPFSSTQPTGNAGNPSATSQPGPQAATTVSAGMAALRQYLNSWGQFGPGFAAVYPKWGGGSEVAQVACRAGAVGGAVYMLGRRVRRIEKEGTRRGNEQSVEESSQETTTAAEPLLRVELDDGTVLKTKRLVRGWTAEPATTMTAAGADEATAPHVEHERIARLVAVVASPLAELFEATLEGAPKPAVATIAFPEQNEEGLSSIPIYAFVHSSDTGECPVGQSVVYLTMIARPDSRERLDNALRSFLDASSSGDAPRCLYQLYYEQSRPASQTGSRDAVFEFPAPSLSLAFDDGSLDAVKEAWRLVVGPDVPEADYMTFTDREGADNMDEFYD